MNTKTSTFCSINPIVAHRGAELISQVRAIEDIISSCSLDVEQEDVIPQASDIRIQADEILFLKDRLNKELADRTGQPLDRIQQDTDRDFFMSPTEAVNYGLIDSVIDVKSRFSADNLLGFQARSPHIEKTRMYL